MRKHIPLYARLGTAVLIFATHATAAPPVIGGCQILPANNYWNTPVDTLPVHPSSDAWIASIGTTQGANRRLHPDWGNNPNAGGINEIVEYGIPFITVGAPLPSTPIVYTAYGSESDPGPFPVPLSAPVEGGPSADGDRHVIAIDTVNCVLYELYRAFPVGNTWQAESGARFPLNSNASRPNGWTSADAAGLAILPGLVKWEEVAAGEITHAIRFTAPNIWGREGNTNKYLWPARHWSTSNTNPNDPPMGARVRLKASFNVDKPGFSAATKVILRAMKKYGMVLADRGSGWYISGMSNVNWPSAVISELKNASLIKGGDFEVVDTLPLQIDPNSEQAVQPPSAPTNLAATPGNGEASFTFSAPADNGGKPVLDYTVSCTPGNQSATAAAAPILVTGLPNGVASVCTVRARNLVFSSEPSASLNVTPGVPALSMSTTALVFPATNVGQASTVQSLLATNAGSGNLSFSGIAITGANAGDFALAGSGTCSATTVLAPGQSCSVAVQFSPGATGARTASLTLSTNVAGSPTTVTLSGSGRTVPGAPQVGTPIPGDQFVYLNFAPPASDGGAPVTSYTATCSGAQPVAGTASPIQVSGLINGMSYTCSVSAGNAAGNGPPSASVTVTPTADPPLALIEALSLKPHGAAGSFGLPMRIGPSGPLPNESRLQGAQNTVVFRFNRTPAIAFDAKLHDLDGLPLAGHPASLPVSVDGSAVSVTFGAVPEGQKLRVLLFEAMGGPFNAFAEVAYLVGDLNASQRVGAADIAGTKARSGQVSNSQNFRADLNRDGTIGVGDVTMVKSRSGAVAP
jgi:hypothetical protein